MGAVCTRSVGRMFASASPGTRARPLTNGGRDVPPIDARTSPPATAAPPSSNARWRARAMNCQAPSVPRSPLPRLATTRTVRHAGVSVSRRRASVASDEPVSRGQPVREHPVGSTAVIVATRVGSMTRPPSRRYPHLARLAASPVRAALVLAKTAMRSAAMLTRSASRSFAPVTGRCEPSTATLASWIQSLSGTQDGGTMRPREGQRGNRGPTAQLL